MRIAPAALLRALDKKNMPTYLPTLRPTKLASYTWS